MACYLVTGGAGFIGSHLVHALVEHGHRVRVLDDFSTGKRENLADIQDKLDLICGSICDFALVQDIMQGVDYCLHHAAIPSVPRSVQDPRASNAANIDGTLNVFLAARDRKVRRVVYASSSSVYGNNEVYPAHEKLPMAPISPYGVTKAANELYAQTFSHLYGMEIVGFRYFNVFGPRQDPSSQYAAVIPLFITRLLVGKQPVIHGDGTQSRDFTYVENVVSANLRACTLERPISGVYNIACGSSCSVLDLARLIGELLGVSVEPEFTPPRPGDIRRSCADITLAKKDIQYEPSVTLREGLMRTIDWFREHAEEI
ncbi:MAG TPA: SDR family oxidoreductase [Candidatus Hydrogenedentes bacterium]|nr:SDR family oxidoreductase [Candidatus Hydrogenedentota bacterium]HOL76733.1 SDR family oxidoreductase [Candidatus Hydrogenedentota bacterium]HPO85306.1 SDR family oxidoreductase [Candidatus Hydrogenedentota bacterium]